VQQVDSAVGLVEQHVPPTIKAVSFHVYTVFRGFTGALCEFLSDAHNSGPSAALKAAGGRYKQIAVELYKDYGPIAEQYVVVTWQYLNHLPLFPQVLNFLVLDISESSTTFHCHEITM
jgi:Rubber elongation factor protein (REF)